METFKEKRTKRNMGYCEEVEVVDDVEDTLEPVVEDEDWSEDALEESCEPVDESEGDESSDVEVELFFGTARDTRATPAVVES